MERKIGEIFEYNGEWYQCLTGYCKDCAFLESKDYCKDLHRKDICTANLIFKKLEKVGEPYDFQKRTFQTYKLHTKPFLSEDTELMAIPSKDNTTIEIELKQNKEDMEEDREYSEEEFKNNPRFQHHKNIEQVINMKKMKEFDINLAKAGKPVCTRDGRKVRIICFDLQSIEKTPIVAAVQVTDIQEVIANYYENGRQFINGISDLDLMMLPEKKEGWIIVSKNATIYDSLEDAKKSFDSDKELCICKVEWEE